MDAQKSDESVELVNREVEDELVEKVDEAFEHALDIATDKIDDVVENIENDEIREIAEIAVNVGAAVAENVGEDVINMAGDKVFEELEKKAKEVGIKSETLTVLLRFTMEAIEDTPIKGVEQKEYAVKLLKALVQSQAMKGQHIPSLQETAIRSVDRGKLDVALGLAHLSKKDYYQAAFSFLNVPTNLNVLKLFVSFKNLLNSSFLSTIIS